MLQKLAHCIVKYYKVTLIVFAVLCIAACACVPFVVKRLNSEVMTYLPEDTATVEGLNFLKENFGINADVMFGVQGASEEDVANMAYRLNLLHYDGAKDGKGFYYPNREDVEAGTVADKKVITQCLWLHADFVDTYSAMFGDTDEAKKVADLFYGDNGTPDDKTDDTYVFILNMDFGSSDDEAFKALDFIKDKIVGDKGEYYAFGTTVMAKDIFENTIGEVWAYTGTGLAIVLVVLFLFTKSWMDPLIMLMTLGVSILLNIGSNIIYPTNSIITFATSALLQMALSIDYAVFLINAYRDELKSTLDPKEALERAIPRTFKSVFASAMTTVGGFVALFFMRFGIGADMGAVLAKGIFTSFVGVLLLQPAFMILLAKPMEKAQHKAVSLKFRKPVKTVIKYRSVVVALFIVAIFPVVLFQADLPLNYFNFVKYEEKQGELYDMVDTASRQLIIAVPLDLENADSIKAQYELCEELRGLKNEKGESSVTFILGLNALIPEDNFNAFMADPTMKKILLEETSAFVNNGYTMYTVGLSGDNAESDESFAAVAEIEKSVKAKFADSKVYVTGLSQAGRDFAKITPNDFQRVTVASVLIIIFILLITFRSVKHSLMLILLIEFGIWLNLDVQKLTGDSVNFMSYIIISSMQLGATVDYAILITSKYRDFRKRMLPAHAAYQATTSSIMSVLTSATILAGACFCVKLMSTVLIVSEVCTLVARGAIISALLTIFILPALLAFFDRPLKSKTMEVPPQDKLSRHIYKRKKNDIKVEEEVQEEKENAESAPVAEPIDGGFEIIE